MNPLDERCDRSPIVCRVQFIRCTETCDAILVQVCSHKSGHMLLMLVVHKLFTFYLCLYTYLYKSHNMMNSERMRYDTRRGVIYYSA